MALILLLKDLARLAHKVTQTATLAAGDSAHGELHILDRVSMALKDRLIEEQRVVGDFTLLDVGICKECVVEDLDKILVGDRLRSTTCHHATKHGYK